MLIIDKNIKILRYKKRLLQLEFMLKKYYVNCYYN